MENPAVLSFAKKPTHLCVIIIGMRLISLCDILATVKCAVVDSETSYSLETSSM